ncbi:MAG: metal-dependent hydrolase [Desulfotomaculaceae bacterium]|nr:metal-dependent hydrolase [Desulfotomaculaceae bacterium]MDD4767314.1 metal-dependent hydrolase [Desulfotomaculaceae bacterium]
MKITFLGHAGFLIEGSKKIAIDPFLTGNPAAKNNPKDIKADLILVSHGHGDHLGDTIEIAKQSKGTVVSVNELAIFCSNKGANSHGMHIGGSHVFDGIKIKLTPAWHGSGFGDECPLEYLGTPCGFVFNLDGKTIYHSGDTGLFGDMELIGRLNKIDLAMLPIGDNYTMGPEDALEAVKMLKSGLVIPMHYNTWPLLKQDPLKFKTEVESNTGSKVTVIAPGESLEF